jgi:hypothetical protein
MDFYEQIIKKRRALVKEKLSLRISAFFFGLDDCFETGP